jgi:HSP20 family molecular chaperone IbpA
MNKHALKYALITIIAIGAIGAVGAQTYYTHELAQRINNRPDSDLSYEPSASFSGQWDPWSDMQRVQAQIDRTFGQYFDALQVPAPGDAAKITLKQQAEDYVVKAVIPGAKEGDIKVNLDGRLLSISAEALSTEKQTAQNGAITSEETYSSAFEQAFTLPGLVNASGMKSDFKDGVLTLTIPKATSLSGKDATG